MMSSGIIIRYSNYLRCAETRVHIMSSNFLIDIRITFDMEQQGHVGLLQVFLFDLQITFDMEVRGHVQCPEESSSIFKLHSIMDLNETIKYYVVMIENTTTAEIRKCLNYVIVIIEAPRKYETNI
jgi:hypothetical protein